MTFEENGVYYIRGIVSVSPSRMVDNKYFCDPNQFVIFTDVAQYLSWIEEVAQVKHQPTQLGNYYGSL